ncbi:MAG TPA: response regulator [Spirochaetota bacterium]|nr:response regulator [Spirochaetota bacterium]HOL57803.1 response regulator [Spirochaetota bacterium]HPP04504.1 response regulator [Spirochaetota bacterium]
MNKILIVEDEMIISKDIELKLKQLGYNVIGVADSYNMILKIFEKDIPDLILMDIFIKGDINGIEASKIIYEKYDLPIIFITADSDTETIQKAKLEGTYGYLIKPIKYEDLKSAIELAFYKYETNKKILKLEEEKRLKEKIIMRQTRFASLGELAALLVHEIRQPLNTIKILSDTINYWASIEKDLSPKCKEHLELLNKISKNVDHINNIIANVNSIIKRNSDVKNEEINVNNIIQDFVSSNIENLKNENIQINLELDSNIKLINFYSIHFKEILTNFLSNSIKAFKKTEKEDKKIIIKTTQNNGKIIIDFMDNAIGIKEEILENIFDPFVTTDKNKEGGVGLGLYIVNNIVTSYNGVVDCFNNELGGATFRIIFETL